MAGSYSAGNHTATFNGSVSASGRGVNATQGSQMNGNGYSAGQNGAAGASRNQKRMMKLRL